MEITTIRTINVDSDLKVLRNLVDLSTLKLFGNFDLEEKMLSIFLKKLLSCSSKTSKQLTVNNLLEF